MNVKKEILNMYFEIKDKIKDCNYFEIFKMEKIDDFLNEKYYSYSIREIIEDTQFFHNFFYFGDEYFYYNERKSDCLFSGNTEKAFDELINCLNLEEIFDNYIELFGDKKIVEILKNITIYDIICCEIDSEYINDLKEKYL